MASLDSLTDGEIRVKLMEFGCPVGPVTATTRKVLLKKLKLLTEQNKGGVGERSYDPRCLATQFSSEDESDGGGGVGTKNRRKSMPPPKSNKSPRRKSPGRTDSILAPLANSTLVDKKKDEEAELHRSSRHSMPLSDFSTYRSSLAPKSPDEDSPSERLASRATLYDSSPQTRFSSNAYSLGLTDGFRSRTQPSLNNFSSSSSPKSNQPYSSEFARRLSSLSTSRHSGKLRQLKLPLDVYIILVPMFIIQLVSNDFSCSF
jgi:membrane protein Man1